MIMDRSHNPGSERPRRTRRSHAQLVPLLWIAVLLASWFVIAEWQMLPDIVSATMAGLP
jgi:hypothetical protein